MMERIGLFSDMVVFMQYAMQVIMAFLMLVMIFVMLAARDCFREPRQ